MILFLHGEDDFSLGRRLRVLRQLFTKKYPQADSASFDFEDQGMIDDVRRALGACEPGLFSSHKMVTFLHPCSLEGPAAEMFAAFIKNRKQVPDDTTLLFVQPGKIRKTHPIASLLFKLSDKEELFPKLDTKDQNAIRKIIEKELSNIASHMSCSREALGMIAAIAGTDRARIASELEKLVAYKGGTGTIVAEDVALLVEESKESAIFEALDALGRGERRQALLLLDRETDGAEGAYPVLAMCAWQVRRMLLVREAYDQELRRPADIASHTKLAPFVVQKMLGTIGNFPIARLKDALTLLSDFDTKLKRGGMDPQVALSLFIWKF